MLEVATGVAGSLAGLLLAEHGADVLKVEPPGGDLARASPAFHVHNRSKRSVTADWRDRGNGVMEKLVTDADVTILDLTPGDAEQYGLDYATLSRENPSLVYLAMPPFGDGGPLKDLSADEGLVAAFAGIMGEQASYDRTPTFILAPVAATSAAILAAGAAAVGLMHRERSGIGQRICVSGLAGALAVQAHSFVKAEHASTPDAWWRRNPLGPIAVFAHFKASDAWFTVAVLSNRFFRNLCLAVKRPEWAEDPRLRDVPYHAPDAELDDWLFAELQQVFATKSRAEWLRILRDADVPAGPALTRAECMAEEQVARIGMRVEMRDPVLGLTTQSGVPLRFSRTPGGVQGPAPPLGDGANEVFAGGRARSRRPSERRPPPPTALAGLRVVDLGNYIAGTYGGSILADLGADVIKVEQPGGDPFRSTGADFLAFNRGKRSLVLDLKTEEGREAVFRLVQTADVFVENLRPGAAARLGLDYAGLSVVNPRLVYASIYAFGGHGPRAGEPGFDLLLQAFGGATVSQGGPDDEPVYHTAAFVDFGAAMLSTFGILAALYEREHSGTGQRVETSLLDASIFYQAGEFLLYDGKPTGERGAPQLRGLSPLYRAYKAADGWFFLDARQEPTGTALHDLLGMAALASGLSLPPRESPPTVSKRPAAGDPADAYAHVFALHTRDTWLRRLTNAGIMAVPILTPLELVDHKQLIANRLIDERLHAEWGLVRQGGALVQFSHTPGRVRRSAPLLGEHTREVLVEAGYSDDEINVLGQRGIVGIDPGRGE